MEYKREVLVPYLTELYGIEVTWHTLRDKYEKYRIRIQEDERILSKKSEIEAIQLTAPVTPAAPPFPLKYKACSIFCGVFAIPMLMLDLGIIYLPLLYGVYYFYKKGKNEQENKTYRTIAENEKKLRQYKTDCNNLEKWKTAIAEKEECYPVDAGRKEELLAELNRCAEIRDKAYSINIIPQQYRNLGAIAYLYEYFSSSKATDLDNIIQTMILSDVNRKISNIENRLNQIISNQHQIYQELSAIHQTAVSIHQQAVQISGQLTSLELAAKEQHTDMKELTDEVKMMRVNSDISTYLQLGTYLKMAQY